MAAASLSRRLSSRLLPLLQNPNPNSLLLHHRSLKTLHSPIPSPHPLFNHRHHLHLTLPKPFSTQTPPNPNPNPSSTEIPTQNPNSTENPDQNPNPHFKHQEIEGPHRRPRRLLPRRRDPPGPRYPLPVPLPPQQHPRPPRRRPPRPRRLRRLLRQPPRRGHGAGARGLRVPLHRRLPRPEGPRADHILPEDGGAREAADTHARDAGLEVAERAGRQDRGGVGVLRARDLRCRSDHSVAEMRSHKKVQVRSRTEEARSCEFSNVASPKSPVLKQNMHESMMYFFLPCYM
ncbi:uncharacterized protein M6B38_187095 [Iris pallida]|uniref:Uncharacterized protein n=1 Tax=Iris pallida TaxID=29817 RepID=A0AAX6EJQ0_IRIPA|nr:uncharacterized protein M6B38_187095 [Iris pallida]